MQPYYTKDGITIWHGDCRDVMPRLPRVQLILTDPPYGIAYETAWRSHSDKLRNPVANDADLSVVRVAWPMAYQLLESDCHWYSFATLKPALMADLSGVFGRAKQLLVWDKGDRGTVGDLRAGFGECCEGIFYGMKGRRLLKGPRPRSVIRLDWSSTMDPVHPTVKPVALLQKLVNWSSESGDTVLDPFMGSGTTLRAAKDLGRKAIGIEVEERYCEIAAERLRQGVLFS